MKATCKKNAIDGILLVNKPEGPTSNRVLQQVKHLYNAKKAGHTGSLDPMATGMLPLCFGEATKFCQYLLDADKCYEVTGLLGSKTTTSDATGEIIAKLDTFSVSETQLKEVLAIFQGLIEQTPSMFSALKHQGQPLYKYARAGVDIERKPRKITIHQLKLHQFDGRTFTMTVFCSKGTYIRNLIEDIGDKLGVYAHMTALHRTYTSGFQAQQMYPLDELQSKSFPELMACLLPTDSAVSYLPSMRLSIDETRALREGKILDDKLTTAPGLIRLYDTNNYFIGLGYLQLTGELKVKRLLSK